VPSGINPLSQLKPAGSLDVADLTHAAHLSPAHWPDSNWWAAFGDEQLNALVLEAIQNSPDINEAAAKVRQAQAIEGLQEAQLLPRVDGNLSSTRERFSTNGTTPHPVNGTWQWVNQGTLNLSYEIDFWGKNRAALEAALGRVKAAEVDQQATRLMLASAVVQAYINFQQTDQEIALETRMLEQRIHILSLTRKRFESELDSQVDIKQVEVSIPASRARIAELNETQELNRNKLAALLGQGPARGAAIRTPTLRMPNSFSLPGQLPAELIGHRPDLVAQRWRVEAASHDIAEAKARFYPNVNLTSFVGLQSLGFDLFADNSSRILGVAPAVSLPIFDGGRLRSNLAAQDATYDIAVERYNHTLIEAVKDVSDQVVSMRWLSERINQQQAGVDTANDAARLIERRYSAGLATYIQVLYAQNTALAQQLLLVRLNAHGLELHASLSRALGGGYVPFNTPEAKIN